MDATDSHQRFSTTFETTQSNEKLALLDDIDRLRSQGISHFVQLPQLIVCGDQSSGKSSALEAISGIPFPIKDNICTRFATEVILRRAPSPSISVGIVPGPSRSKDERTRLLDFKYSLPKLEEFSNLVDRAKNFMGVIDGSSAFSTDVLRLEISGPDQPHLTIVDLPGLIHSENKLQTAKDIEVVQSMVHEYMSNRRSIILAVVSAKNDYANQIILKLARQIDKHGDRTMGIITKPDTLSAGSESETAFISLAKNMDISFRLGWHILRNRNFEERNTSLDERHQAEKRFFEQGAWREFPRDAVGVSALRDKLSDVLFDQIKAELPSLIKDIQKQIDGCQKVLSKLGPTRGTVDQQRLYLLQVSQDFQEISKAAVDGSYGHEFFGDPRSRDGVAKRLRAVVQNLNVQFAETVRLRGQLRRVVEENEGPLKPGTVTRTDFIGEIKDLLKTTRGRELPGTFNPLIVGDLFCEQSKPWESLARQHIKRTWDNARLFLDLLIAYLTDESIMDGLFQHVIDPLMEENFKLLSRKLEEILKPYQKGHPITYNHYYTETVQKVKEKRYRDETTQKLQRYLYSDGRQINKPSLLPEKSVSVTDSSIPMLVSSLTSKTEADMDRYACAEILDCMEAYYKVNLLELFGRVTLIK